MKTALYAAYGSNLNHDQMARRCPDAEFLGTGKINHFRLVFRHVADIEFSKGSKVLVGLWRVTEDCMDALDAYEGYPTLYDRTFLNVEQPDGSTVEAWVYFMLREGYQPPLKTYYQSIADGYRHCGLPLKKLQADLITARDLYFNQETL